LIKRNIVIVDDILKRKGQGMRRYRSQSKGHRGERAKRDFQAGGQRQGGAMKRLRVSQSWFSPYQNRMVNGLNSCFSPQELFQVVTKIFM